MPVNSKFVELIGKLGEKAEEISIKLESHLPNKISQWLQRFTKKATEDGTKILEHEALTSGERAALKAAGTTATKETQSLLDAAAAKSSKVIEHDFGGTAAKTAEKVEEAAADTAKKAAKPVAKKVADMTPGELSHSNALLQRELLEKQKWEGSLAGKATKFTKSVAIKGMVVTGGYIGYDYWSTHRNDLKSEIRPNKEDPKLSDLVITNTATHESKTVVTGESKESCQKILDELNAHNKEGIADIAINSIKKHPWITFGMGVALLVGGNFGSWIAGAVATMAGGGFMGGKAAQIITKCTGIGGGLALLTAGLSSGLHFNQPLDGLANLIDGKPPLSDEAQQALAKLEGKAPTLEALTRIAEAEKTSGKESQLPNEIKVEEIKSPQKSEEKLPQDLDLKDIKDAAINPAKVEVPNALEPQIPPTLRDNGKPVAEANVAITDDLDAPASKPVEPKMPVDPTKAANAVAFTMAWADKKTRSMAASGAMITNQVAAAAVTKSTVQKDSVAIIS